MKQSPQIDESEILLTKDELRKRLNVPSTRLIDELVRRRRIPVIKLGYRTLRFNWKRVSEAIAKLEIREIGR